MRASSTPRTESPSVSVTGIVLWTWVEKGEQSSAVSRLFKLLDLYKDYIATLPTNAVAVSTRPASRNKQIFFAPRLFVRQGASPHHTLKNYYLEVRCRSSE